MPTVDGAPQPSSAMAVTKMAGGGVGLTPLPLSGGRRRGSRRLTKKMLKMLKGMPKSKLAKLMKGGEEATEMTEGEAEAPVGARRRSRKGGKGKKTARKSRRHGLLY